MDRDSLGVNQGSPRGRGRRRGWLFTAVPVALGAVLASITFFAMLYFGHYPRIDVHLNEGGERSYSFGWGPREVDRESREAVRRWLRENLHDPEWEEVRWWPAKPMNELRHQEIKRLEDAQRDWDRQHRMALTAEEKAVRAQLIASLEGLATRPVENGIRLTYRSRNQAGVREMRSEAFEVRRGKATPDPQYLAHFEE